MSNINRDYPIKSKVPGGSIKPPKLPAMKIGDSLVSREAWQNKFQGSLAGLVIARQVIGRAVDQWDTLAKLRDHRHPDETAPAHLARVRKSASAVFDRVHKDSVNALSVLERDYARQKEVIDATLRGGVDPAIAAETRAVLRAMDQKERTSTILRALAEKDASVLGAVYTGNPVLIGMEAKHYASTVDAIARAVCPDNYQSIQTVEAARQHMMKVIDQSMQALDSAAGTAKDAQDYIQAAVEADLLQAKLQAGLMDEITAEPQEVQNV